jgi:hypothetical protein
MAVKTKEVGKVRTKLACVITVGASPVVWEKRIVRNRHSGKLVEVDLHELPPLDPGDEGIPYAFRAGEEVAADHSAVLDAPGCFVPVDATRDW